MASENACALQSREKYYFSKQNITSNVITFWYQFKHFLKAENSEDSLASSYVEFSIGLSCNPLWDRVTIAINSQTQYITCRLVCILILSCLCL